MYRISCVIVGMFASGVVYLGFKSQSGKIKDIKISMGCFSAKHAVLRSNNKD